MKTPRDLRLNWSGSSSNVIYLIPDPLDFQEFQIYFFWSSATRPKLSGHSFEKAKIWRPKTGRIFNNPRQV